MNEQNHLIIQHTYTIWHVIGYSAGTAFGFVMIFWANKAKDDIFDAINKLVAWVLRKEFKPRSRGSASPSGIPQAPVELVTVAAFKEHKDGDEKVLQTILHGLDQNARIVTDAAIQVGNSAKEMRETSQLIQLSQTAQREEFEKKIGEIHDKVNMTNTTVANLAGKVETVIEIAKNSLGKTG